MPPGRAPGLEAFAGAMGPALTPGQVGQAVTELATDPGRDQGAYRLSAAGLSPLG